MEGTAIALHPHMTQRDQTGPDRQGDTTHAAFLEGRHGRHGGSEESEGAPQTPREGHARLREDRQQHDEAEKNSEAERLAREAFEGENDSHGG